MFQPAKTLIACDSMVFFILSESSRKNLSFNKFFFTKLEKILMTTETTCVKYIKNIYIPRILSHDQTDIVLISRSLRECLSTLDQTYNKPNPNPY